MTWLASVFVAFLTAIIGAFGTGGLGVICVDWFRISSREGGSGYMVIFMGLLGGLLGLIIGLVCARVVAAGVAPSFGKGLGVAAGTTLGLLVIALVICWLAADFDTKLNGRPVELHAEIRCPAGFAIPDEATTETWFSCIGTASRRSTSYGALRWKEAKQVEGRWVIPTTLVLETSVREKLFFSGFGEKSEMFVLRFPAKPDERYFKWSDWVDSGWQPVQSRPDDATKFNVRYRLQVVPEPAVVPAEPPGPSADEVHATKEAAEIAALASLTPDSPLEESLKFTHYTQSPENREKAGAIIGRRASVVAELSAEILSPDQEISDRALRALAFVKPLPAELAGPVGVVGEKVVDSLQCFNASVPSDDPTYQSAADASVLFSSWFQGHHALHDFAGVNGLPQLTLVLSLARQREDSYVMKNDVVRIAQYYVNQWSEAPAAAQ